MNLGEQRLERYRGEILNGLDCQNHIKLPFEGVHKKVGAVYGDARAVPPAQPSEGVLRDVYNGDMVAAVGQRDREPSTAAAYIQDMFLFSNDVIQHERQSLVRF